jgi:hypothetical protein
VDSLAFRYKRVWHFGRKNVSDASFGIKFQHQREREEMEVRERYRERKREKEAVEILVKYEEFSQVQNTTN